MDTASRTVRKEHPRDPTLKMDLVCLLFLRDTVSDVDDMLELKKLQQYSPTPFSQLLFEPACSQTERGPSCKHGRNMAVQGGEWLQGHEGAQICKVEQFSVMCRRDFASLNFGTFAPFRNVLLLQG